MLNYIEHICFNKRTFSTHVKNIKKSLYFLQIMEKSGNL